MNKLKYPILYSFRRCPYAIRTRMVIKSAKIVVELREIKLKNKPKDFLEISPKGTVPVLITNSGQVLEESLDIIYWALRLNDPNNLLSEYNLSKNEFDELLKKLDDWGIEYKYFEHNPLRTVKDSKLVQHMFLKTDQGGGHI